MAGRDCKGYYNSGTYASPTKTELKRITDVKIPESMTTSKFKMRGYEGTVTSVGYVERSVTFKYHTKKAGRTDSVLAALLTAMRTRAPIEMWFVDQAIATVGATGVHGFFMVTAAPRDEADEDNPSREFTLEPADHEESGTVVEVEPYTTPS
jgi:hypothetical protein